MNHERSDRKLTGWLLFLTVGAICVSIGTPLVGARVFHAADVLLSFSPWRDQSAEIVRPTNGQVTDTVDVVVPMRTEYRRRVSDGDFPSWTPYPSGGQPLGGVPDLGTLSPLNLPYLIFPPSYAPGAAKLLEMLVAVGFTFLFLRRAGLGRPASILGGFIYAFSGFQVVWTNWPQTHVGALIPATFWAVDRCVRERGRRGVIPLALVVAVMFLEGFPAVAGYAVVGAGIWGIVRVLASGRSADDDVPAGRIARGLFVAAGATALGVALSASQLLPFLDRVREVELPARETLRGQHLPLRGLATLAIPDAFGSPVDRVYYGSPNYVELQAFIGCTALLLMALTLFLPRRSGEWRWLRATLGSGAVGCALLIYVGGLPLRLLEALPFLGANPVGRLRSVFGFLLAGLAAAGFDSLGAPAPDRKPPRTLRVLRVLVVAAAAAVVAYALARGWEIAGDVGYRRYAIRQAALPGAAALTAGVILVIALRRRGASRRIASVAWALPIVVVVEALAFAMPFWPRIPRDQFYPTTRAHDFLAARLGAERFAAEGRTMYTGTATYYALRTVNAHAFQQPSWAEALRAVDPNVFHASRRVPFFAPRSEVATSPLLDRIAARFFVAAPEVPVFGVATPVPSGVGVFRLESGQTVEAPLPPGAIRAVVIPLVAAEIPSGLVARLRVSVHDAVGQVVGGGARRVYGDAPAGDFHVAVTETPDRTATSIRLELDAPRGRVTFRAAAPGAPAVGTVRSADDGLRVVFSDEAVIYERLRALPRIRWATVGVVIADPASRLARLSAGVESHRVVLSGGASVADGGLAALRVVSDGGDSIRVHVTAGGPGFLVVADAIQDGWRAELDGNDVPLLDADHAVVAVRVPAGEHSVLLRYEPDGRQLGIMLALGAIALLFVVGFFQARGSRRARLVSVGPDPGSEA